MPSHTKSLVMNSQQNPQLQAGRGLNSKVAAQKPLPDLGGDLPGNSGAEKAKSEGLAKNEQLCSKSNKSTSYKLSSFATSDSSIKDFSDVQGSYTVNQKDSLMKIAFEIYGDYEKWRVIKDLNREKIGYKNTIKEGMELVFPEPSEKFVQNKNGDPYLIKRGDTLISISKNLYDTSRHWKAIWKNNKPLIKDPNKIFAGFTIYIPVIRE